MNHIFCPRCSCALESGNSDSTFYHCPECDGALVDVVSLLPLIENLAEHLDIAKGTDEQPPNIPDKGAGVACPKCKQVMENYGYLSTDHVKIDGCHPCQVVWTDSDELTAMAAMHARSVAKKRETEQQSKLFKNEQEFQFALRRIRSQRHGTYRWFDYPT